MTAFSTERLTSKDWHGGGHLATIVLAIAVAAGALTLVAYLLWPTWGSNGASGPDRLPISIGGTLFNVPPAAIRMKIQRHSGPQERIDLDFSFPSLEPPEPAAVVLDLEEPVRTRRDEVDLVGMQNSNMPQRWCRCCVEQH